VPVKMTIEQQRILSKLKQQRTIISQNSIKYNQNIRRTIQNMPSKNIITNINPVKKILSSDNQINS